MNGRPSTPPSRSIHRQVSISKDDDSTQVNGELIPDDRFDGLETENSNKTTHQESSSSVAGNVNSLAGEDNQLPSIRVSPRVYGGDDDGDKDDIYNFEFSEDQKQAIQELCNLKLDLGFTADEDSRSGLYDPSERIRQLNEEMAKEPPVPSDGPSQTSVKFKDNPVDFISSTPEPQLDSEEEPGSSQSTPRCDAAEEDDRSGQASGLPEDGSLSGIKNESGEQDQVLSAANGSQNCSTSTSKADDDIKYVSKRSPEENTQSDAESSQVDTGNPGSTFHADRVKTKGTNSSSPSNKQLSVHNPAVCDTMSAARVVGSWGLSPRPKLASMKPAGGLRGVESKKMAKDLECDDLALVECSGKFRMMSVAELMALQRHPSSSRTPDYINRTPRPPSSPSTRSPRLAPSSARCQSARGSSTDRRAVDWKTEEDERRARRDEADAVFMAWLRKKQREAAERRRLQQQQLNNQQAASEECDKSSSDGAFQAWLRAKQKQHRNEQKSKKSDTPEDDQNADKSSRAYVKWLRAKAKQVRVERRYRKAEMEDLAEGVVVHKPEDCQRAYRKWLKRKNRESRRQQEMERHLATVCALTARRSKKSVALAEALSKARALRYTDVNGRR